VLLALAQELRVLPEDLNALLICVVVLSMALTPVLADWGDRFEVREQQARARRPVPLCIGLCPPRHEGRCHYTWVL
jgi:predicted Kef-type K+ transport protein